MKRHLFLLSCETYDSFSPTDYCHADAELIRQTLEAYCDYNNTNLISQKGLYVGSPEADPRKILDELSDVIKASELNDSILFYFAGHGMLHNNDAFLVLPDTNPSDIENTALNLKDINKIMHNNGRNSFIIFDACHLGESTRDGQEVAFDIAIKRSSICATLASCSRNQSSYPINKYEQGAFTYFLCKAIENWENSTPVYLESLKIKVCDLMEDWTKTKHINQTPTLKITTVGNSNFAIRNTRLSKDSILINSKELLEVADRMDKEVIVSNNQNLPTKSIIDDLNSSISYLTPAGLVLPKTTNIPQLLNCAMQLNERERSRIEKTYAEMDFEAASESIFFRSINILRARILSLGTDFVCEMVGINDASIVNDLPPFKTINLAFDLGFIDETGRMNLLHSSEYVNHYMSHNTNDEMPQDQANIVIRSCIQYILHTEVTSLNFEFNDFRNNLKLHVVSENSETLRMLKNSPYFFKKTTVRALLNLLEETKEAEFETVVSNMVIMIPSIWDDLLSEERYEIAMRYSKYSNSGEHRYIKPLHSILVKVHGFDYVPETLRSSTFIRVAENLINIHYGVNNFYNEPLAIKNLEQLGSKFPKPALKICITATLLVKLGNSYGISWDAQYFADIILERLTREEWRAYLEHYLLNEKYIIPNITGEFINTTILNRWKDIVKSYNLHEIPVNNKVIKQLLKT